MYNIVAEKDGSFTIKLPNRSALLQFLTAIPQAQPEETYITNAQAMQIAQERGLTLPASTLISACSRGTIEGAQKQGGRWKIPQHSFMRWLSKEHPDEEAALWGESGH